MKRKAGGYLKLDGAPRNSLHFKVPPAVRFRNSLRPSEISNGLQKFPTVPWNSQQLEKLPIAKSRWKVQHRDLAAVVGPGGGDVLLMIEAHVRKVSGYSLEFSLQLLLQVSHAFSPFIPMFTPAVNLLGYNV